MQKLIALAEVFAGDDDPLDQRPLERLAPVLVVRQPLAQLLRGVPDRLEGFEQFGTLADEVVRNAVDQAGAGVRLIAIQNGSCGQSRRALRLALARWQRSARETCGLHTGMASMMETEDA